MEPAAAAWSFDPQPVAGLQVALRLARQRLAVEQVRARLRRRRRPRGPRGGWRRRSVISVKRIGASASISRTMPSPPRCAPAPPLPRRSESSRTRSGNSVSSASTGVFRVFDIATWIALGPSASGAGALAAAERLVVGEVLVGQGQVVHRPLALGGRPGGRRRGPRSPGRRRGWRSRRCRRRRRPGSAALSRQPGGARTSIGRWAPARGRRVGVGEDADGEEGGRPGHRERAVEVALDLRRRCRRSRGAGARRRSSPRPAGSTSRSLPARSSSSTSSAA